MSNNKDITNKRFGRLIAKRFDSRKKGDYYWYFKCDCGSYKIIKRGSVVSGKTRSCGCYSRDIRKLFPNGITHHMTKTRFYKTYMGLKFRCENPKATYFARYGGRGIKCLWKSFEHFRDDMYESYQSHVDIFGVKNTQIDRVDNNGHYCKENCRWATSTEQNLNKSNARIIEYNGNRKPLSEWAKIYGLPINILFGRINRGWEIKVAIETPNLHGKWHR